MFIIFVPYIHHSYKVDPIFIYIYIKGYIIIYLDVLYYNFYFHITIYMLLFMIIMLYYIIGFRYYVRKNQLCKNDIFITTYTT